MSRLYVARLAWRGRVRIVARRADGSVEVDEFENLITDAGLNLIADALTGAVSTPEIRYVALGSSNTPVSANQTALGDERFRKQVSQQTNPNTGEAVSIVYIAPFEATDFMIQEIGWFAGPDATDQAGSGILLARVLYSRAKSDLESLQITRTDTIGRV